MAGSGRNQDKLLFGGFVRLQLLTIVAILFRLPTKNCRRAWRLGFKHPVTKEMLAFEAPPPPAYLATLEALRA